MRATPATPLYVWVTSRLKPVSDDGNGAIRVTLSDSSDETIQHSDAATVNAGIGIRTTGWLEVPTGFNGGTARLYISNVRVTATTLELAIRNKI